MTIDESDVIVVPDINYLHQLNKLIEQTPTRTVANYFAWRHVLFSASLLSDLLFVRNQEYNAAITGKLKPDSRLFECVRQTMH